MSAAVHLRHRLPFKIVSSSRKRGSLVTQVHTACGLFRSSERVTTDADRVTCRKCRAQLRDTEEGTRS